ncbi:hypothetical protein EBS80_02730 [bacterium]|nr:hypothetical protein [bacterium]
MNWGCVGCHFLSGTSPNESVTRLFLFAAGCMLRDKQNRATFRFGEGDEVVGEGDVSTRGEYVVLGCYGGIKCEVVVEFGPRRYEASVLVTPRFDPDQFLDLEGTGFVRIPYEMYYPDGVPAVGEA